jgi:hypothetical protein
MFRQIWVRRNSYGICWSQLPDPLHDITAKLAPKSVSSYKEIGGKIDCTTSGADSVAFCLSNFVSSCARERFFRIQDVPWDHSACARKRAWERMRIRGWLAGLTMLGIVHLILQSSVTPMTQSDILLWDLQKIAYWRSQIPILPCTQDVLNTSTWHHCKVLL